MCFWLLVVSACVVCCLLVVGCLFVLCCLVLLIVYRLMFFFVRGVVCRLLYGVLYSLLHVVGNWLLVVGLVLLNVRVAYRCYSCVAYGVL